MEKYNILFKINIFLINIFSYFFTILRINKLYSSKNNWKSIKQNKKSKSISIIALGPCLQLDKISNNEDYIVINHFYKIKTDKFQKPKYYILYDPFFFNEKNISKTYELMKIYNETIFILNGKFKKYFKNQNKKNILFVYGWGPTKLNNDKKVFNGLIPPFNNVVHVSIYLSILLGYKNINIFGMDYNLFCKSKKNHIYKEEDNDILNLRKLLFQYSFTTYFHSILNKYAISQNISIVNKCENSLLNVYKKS